MGIGFDKLMDNYLSSLDMEYIESFRGLVSTSIEKEFEKIRKNLKDHEDMEFSSKQDEYYHRSWIEDDGVFMNDVKALADELSIVALYRLVELKHKELLMLYRNETDGEKYSYWRNVLNTLPTEAKSLLSFSSIDELRLVNNSIKHQGKVSKSLANEFPEYGAEGDELSNLDAVFNRLKTDASKYIKELYSIIISLS